MKNDATHDVDSHRGSHPLDAELAGAAVPNTIADVLLGSLSSRFPFTEGIRKSREAFLRDLPDLLSDPSSRGKWVAYYGDERVGIAADDEPLIQECRRRGLSVDQYMIDTIEPKPATPEQVDFPMAWQ